MSHHRKFRTAFNDAATKALPFEKAIETFDWLADMEDIAHGYTRNGCHVRAYTMARRLSEAGIPSKMAWAMEGRKPLSVTPPVHPRGAAPVEWWFHVAPVVTVRRPDGRKQDMVFDPALFDGPVTLKEWGKVMHAARRKLAIRAHDAPLSKGKEHALLHKWTYGMTDAQARRKMRGFLLNERKGPPLRVVFASASRAAAHPHEKPFGPKWMSQRAVPPVLRKTLRGHAQRANGPARRKTSALPVLS